MSHRLLTVVFSKLFTLIKLGTQRGKPIHLSCDSRELRIRFDKNFGDLYSQSQSSLKSNINYGA